VEFYERISTESLPVWMGEQYLEYHRATYTTQGRMKSLHRQLEHALVESEAAATLAFIRRQQIYPKKEFDRLWQVLLLNQFHDHLEPFLAPTTEIPHGIWRNSKCRLTAGLT
jgi:alpha-mannosidase